MFTPGYITDGFRLVYQNKNGSKQIHSGLDN
jgi:hypothetical protein